MKAFVTRRKRLAGTIAVLVVAASAIAAVSVSGAQARSGADELKGAGATFPAPLIAAWQQKYEAAKGVKITYNPIGSGGGISAITNKTVDFGASDAPMTPDQFKSCGGCVELPWALSATSVMYNLPGLPNNLHITGPIIAGHLPRPDQEVERPEDQGRQQGRQPPVDGHHPRLPERLQRHDVQLHDVPEHGQQAVEEQPGRGTSVNWPAGVGARGSSGVSGVISQNSRRRRLRGHRLRPEEPPEVLLGAEPREEVRTARARRHQGRLAGRPQVQPAVERAVDREPARQPTLRKAYPICTYTYVILRTQSDKANLLKPFVTWALTSGQQYGPPLIFQPIPKYVVTTREGDAQEGPLLGSQNRADVSRARTSTGPRRPPAAGPLASRRRDPLRGHVRGGAHRRPPPGAHHPGGPRRGLAGDAEVRPPLPDDSGLG